MAGPWRKILFAILTLAVLAVLVIYSRGAIHEQFNWARLVRAVKAARPSYLILSVAAMFAAYAIRALRWQVFCRSLGRCSFLNVYNGTLMGYAGLFLLGRAGEPIRPLLLARKCRFTVSSMFGIWLLERLFDLGATAVLLGLSLHVAVSDAGDRRRRRLASKIPCDGGFLACGSGRPAGAGGVLSLARGGGARSASRQMARAGRLAQPAGAAIRRVH